MESAALDGLARRQGRHQLSIDQEDVTESGASIPTRLRWRLPVEITWLVVTVLADLILLVEQAYWFLAIVALLNTLGFWHVLQDRTLPRAPYWLSVAAIFVAIVGTLVSSILEPTGSASESLCAVVIVIIMVVVLVYALRPRRVSVWLSGSIGPSGNSVAWDEARTRRAHRRSTLITFGTLAMAVAFSGAAVAGALHSDSRTERLEAIGTRHEGTIVGPGSEGKIHRKRIDVRFERDGQASTIEIRVDDAGPPYEVGQTVEVLIDPNDPNIYTIRGESNDSQAFVWAFSLCFVLAFGFLVGFVFSLWGLRQQRRFFRTADWRGARFDYASSGSWEKKRHVLRFDDRSKIHLVYIAVPVPWIGPTRRMLDDEYLEVIGDCDRHGFVRFDDSSRIFRVSKPIFANPSGVWTEAIVRRRTPMAKPHDPSGS